MKKIIVICVALLLIAAFAVPALAEGTAEVKISSTGEIRRGEEVTVTVSTSQISALISGYIEFDFDVNVFDWVSGKCLVPNTSMATVRKNPAGIVVGTFSFDTSAAQDYSGDLFQITLKVKNGAPFGNTSIYGAYPSFHNASGDVTANVTPAVINVVCDHNYGDWTFADEHTHKRQCSIADCGHEEANVPHTWDSGKIDPVPTCTAEGVKTFTCSGCSAQRTEAVPMIDHSWDAGTVTKKTSCSEEGEKTYKCTGCDATRTEAIAKSKHKYDNSCDTTCNACGAERQTTHKYAEKWTTDETGHWHECTICGHRKDEAAHKPGPEPTEQTSQNCTVCGYIIKEALGHTHDYQVEWSADGQGHWHACSGCENKSEYQEHVFDNTCDGNCNICGYERETEHIYYENYMSSQDGHWHECRVCGYQLEMEHHTPNAEGMCTACGYQGTAADHTHSYPEKWQWDVTGHWQECECGEHSSIQSHTWDDGEIIKKPTDTTDGARTYKCTVCGAEKTELIPAGTVVTDSFPWMVLLIVGGVLILGVIAYIVFGMVASKRESGKYSESADQSTEPEHSDVT